MNMDKSIRIRLYFKQIALKLHETDAQLLVLTTIAAFVLPVLSLLSIQNGRALERKLETMQNQSKILEEKIKKIDEAENTLRPFQNEKELLSLAIPDEESPAELLDKLNLVLGRQKLSLSSLRIDKVENIENEKVSAINVNLEFVGLYPSISAILDDFERNNQQFDMQSLRISRRLQDVKLETNLVLKTYYYKNGQ